MEGRKVKDTDQRDDQMKKKSSYITRLTLFTDNLGRLIEERTQVWGVLPKGFARFQSRGFVNIEVQPLGLPGAKIGVKFAIKLDADTIEDAFKILPVRMEEELEKAKYAGVQQYRDQIKQHLGPTVLVPSVEDILRAGGAVTRDIQWGKRT
jgi:hypothetical protein